MRLLVTGGNGYVGRTVVRRLYDHHDVMVIDNLRFGAVRFADDERQKFALAPVDIADAGAVRRVMDDFVPDAVIHLAAIHYIPECERNPSLTTATNVLGTVSLLDAAPPDCRFVFASSGAVYAPEDDPHDEVTSPTSPSDVYGWSKLQGEQWVAHLAPARGIAAVTVRLFNAVGPGETNPHLFPEIVAQLKAGRRTLELGNLTPRRDYVHVDDIADGFVACATVGAVEPGKVTTVNLGTGRHHSVAEVLDMVRQASGVDFAVQQDPARLRAVDRPVLAARIDRIGEAFAWAPRRSVEQAIADLWNDPDLRPDLVEAYR
ncbi:MAG: NAD-dependent epimerase/dehydratase family protein [Acidimicrobiia bacterium]